MLTRKNSGPMKYPREQILDSLNTFAKKIWTHKIPTKARWHTGTRPSRPTMAHDPRNLAHLFKIKSRDTVFSEGQSKDLSDDNFHVFYDWEK